MYLVDMNADIKKCQNVMCHMLGISAIHSHKRTQFHMMLKLLQVAGTDTFLLRIKHFSVL